MRHLGMAVLVLASLRCVAVDAARGTGPGGYTWKDCNEPDGPPCTYDLTADTDGSTGLCSGEIYNDGRDNLGFTFPFYGTNYTDYAISANGVIYLPSHPACCDDNEAALTGTEGRPFIATLWDDWAGDNDDSIAIICPDPGCSNSGPLTFVESFQRGSGVDGFGTAYKEFGWFSTAHHHPICTEDYGEQATFGLRLYANGQILMLYNDTSLLDPTIDNGASATIGITAGSGGRYTQVSHDSASIPQNPYTILFTPPCTTLNCTNLGVAPPTSCGGSPQTFTVTTTGGTTPMNVTWDFDGDTLTDATGSPASTSLPVGSWPVTVTVTDSCPDPGPQTCSLAGVATVIDPPTPRISAGGPLAFCAARGESVTLDAGGPYATYQWLRNSVTLSGATSQTYVATVSGTYQCTVTAGGCSATSGPIDVDASSCTGACPSLICRSLTITPPVGCEGVPQQFQIVYTGGQGAVNVSWDFDGDTIPEAIGNPVSYSLGVGTYPNVVATAVDSCVNPGVQTCSANGSTSVTVGGSTLGEISGLGSPPLLVSPDARHITVQFDPQATAYNINADNLSSWYFPSQIRGTVCWIQTWTDNLDGTITLDYNFPVNHWILVTASNKCGEGPAGRNSRGFEPTAAATWEHCGALP